jgi:CRP-like cAMP-binding protein
VYIETSFYGPNEFLLQKDDLLESVYYISRGSMEVLDNGTVVAILGKLLL